MSQKTPPLTICDAGLERNSRNGKCVIPGSCDPNESEPCDKRKREKCLIHSTNNYYVCQCAPNESRHSVSEICCKFFYSVIYFKINQKK